MSEDLYELPKGWVWVQLENCVEILDSQRIPVNADEREKRILGKSQSELYPYYGATGQVGWIDEYLFDDELILLGEDGAPFLELFKNKAYLIKQKSWVNNHAHVLKALESLALNTFICHYLNIVDYHNYVTGTTRLKLNQSLMKKIAIPLAPLPEQYRIVDKIEELFTELDAGVELFKKLKLKLKRYRQAVLKAAVEGSLTKEWREANQGKLEPASILLERILKQRREKWEAEQLAKMEAQGKTPKDDSWKLKYKEPIAPDTSELPELPDGWCWQSFGQAFNVYVGATPSRKRLDFWEGTIPWVSSGEVAFCRIYNTEEKITQLGLENSSTEIHPPGTVLLGMIGEGKTRGQVAILDIPACHNQNSAAIRVSETGMPPEYIYYFLESEYERTRKLGSGNNQPALNKNRVQLMVFPCPPLEEQYKIAEELQLKFSITDQLEKTIDANLKRAEKLRQSILKQAFQGKLVPQDPNDEPAEKLLERIKAEKAKQTTTKTKRKTKSKKQSDLQLEIPLK
jgi:type I restriction enzyme S subunit